MKTASRLAGSPAWRRAILVLLVAAAVGMDRIVAETRNDPRHIQTTRQQQPLEVGERIDRGPDRAPGEGAVTWRFEFDNDVVFGSDNTFTNGVGLQKHGRLFSTWKDARGTPAFGKILSKPFLPKSPRGRFYREGWAVGQLMQTPDCLECEELQSDDVPYAGFLGFANNWSCLDDDRFNGFEWLMGLVGPVSNAEQLQTFVHDRTGAAEPRGWDHQLENEPVLNFGYMWKRKIWRLDVGRGWTFDGALNAQGTLGSFVVSAGGALETRFGYNMPRGFVYIPEPIANNQSFDTMLPPARRGWTAYLSAVVRGSYIPHMMSWDGNNFTDSHRVDRDDTIGSIIYGLHLRRPRWGVSLNWWQTTNVFQVAALADTDRRTLSFGTIMIEWRQ